MKTSIFKLFVVSATFIFIFSCSKNDETLKTGSLAGRIKLYDLYVKENIIFNDAYIEVTSSSNDKTIISVDSDGSFKIDEIPVGETLIAFSKPGYGGIGSISITNTINIDTISEVVLFEDIPFSYLIENMELNDSIISWSGSIDYETNEIYMVGTYFFFSKQPNVSCNNYEFELLPGIFSNVTGINLSIRTGATLNIADLMNNGFNYGDTVYITVYMINFASKDVFWGIENNNFKLITYNLQNQSNIYSLVL